MSTTIEESILSGIRQYLCSEILEDHDVGDLGPNQDLIGEGILDSLGILLLVEFVEGEYDVIIEPEEVVIENFSSLRAIAGFVAAKQVAEAADRQ